MRAMPYLFLFCVAMFTGNATAQITRNTNCNDYCRVQIPFGNMVSPGCRMQCDKAKETMNRGIPVPTPPSGSQMRQLACMAQFEKVVQPIRAACTGFRSQSGAASDQAILNDAVNLLVQKGIFAPAEFNNVSIRWCSNITAGGITPDRDVVILNDGIQGDPEQVAITLAHEMVHIRQYRNMGTDNFKCAYANMYVNCGGCQDNGHPMERDAFQFEGNVERILNGLPPQGFGR